jgi:hypothetical protein
MAMRPAAVISGARERCGAAVVEALAERYEVWLACHEGSGGPARRDKQPVLVA